MIRPAANANVIEWPASTVWFDADGILYSVSKKMTGRSLDDAKKTVTALRELIGSKKICMLVDITHSSPTSREVREYTANALPEFIKAMAMVSASPVGKMLGNLFFAIKPQSFPTKVFGNESEAKNWLSQYL